MGQPFDGATDAGRRVSTTSVEDKVRRLQRLETEVEVNRRARHNEAITLFNAIRAITPDDVVHLMGVAPAIGTVAQYTQEDIEANKNGEIQMIKDLFLTLSLYVDEALTHFEDKLC